MRDLLNVDHEKANMFAVVTFALMVFFASCISAQAVETQTMEIVVPDDYPTIQEAINNADSGDTVFVKSGFYYEHVTVNRSVSLVGENVHSTVVDANGTGRVFSVSQGYVNITGFTIRKSGGGYNQDAGVWIEGPGLCSVFGNIFADNDFFGVHVYYAPSNNISGNFITRTQVMSIIVTSSSGNIISGNTLENHFCGIDVHASANENHIFGNVIRKGDIGIVVDDSHRNTISCNNITDHKWEYGYNRTGEKFGISLQECHDNVISGNLIADNDGNGVQAISAGTNRVYHNNFISNSKHADVSPAYYANIWDDGYPSGGNYWSDCSDSDSNGDGIGDIPYFIKASNTDHYPLMGMFSEFNATFEYQITTVCNSTISDFRFNGTALKFIVSGGDGTTGFVRICIPQSLMSEPYKVTVDGATPYFVNYTLYDNGTHRWIYVAYQHSTHDIVIVAEFSLMLVLPSLMTATLLVAVIKKRRLIKHYTHYCC